MKITGKLAEKGFHAFDAEPKMHQGHKISHTWIVVADSKKSHLYRKVESGLELIANTEWDGTNIESFDGHFFKNSAGGEKRDPDGRDKKKHHEGMEFIHSLAEWLDMADNERVFDKLVLVADPHTLGSIRTHLSHKVQDRVIGELDKDLTAFPLKEIQEHISHIVAF